MPSDWRDSRKFKKLPHSITPPGIFYHTFTMSANLTDYEPPRNLPLPPRPLRHAKSANNILLTPSLYFASRDPPRTSLPPQQQSPMIDVTLYTPDVTFSMNGTLTRSNSPSIWDTMLKDVAATKHLGRQAANYRPYYALAPCNQEQETLTFPAWRLGKFRGEGPPELAKLGMGSAICLQDVSQREHPFYPNLPTIFGTLVRPLWREGEHIVCELDTHLYSYTLIPAPASPFVMRVAIPHHLIIKTDHIPMFTDYARQGGQ